MKQRARQRVLDKVDVLILDNRDSFTANIAQAFIELGARTDVVSTDAVTASSILSARPRLLCVGPGPRGPAELPHLIDVVRGVDGHVPMLGVCLGLQAIVRARGGTVTHARAPMHGKRDAITHDGTGLFLGLPSPLWVMRYHSLVATQVPASLTVTGSDRYGQVMAVADVASGLHAVQFHPESIGTAGGLVLLKNALACAGMHVALPKLRAGAIPPAHDVGPGFSDAFAASYGGIARLKVSV